MTKSKLVAVRLRPFMGRVLPLGQGIGCLTLMASDLKNHDAIKYYFKINSFELNEVCFNTVGVSQKVIK